MTGFRASNYLGQHQVEVKVHLPLDLYQRLKANSKESRHSMAEIIRQLLYRYLDSPASRPW